jgi:hypothetical protein
MNMFDEIKIGGGVCQLVDRDRGKLNWLGARWLSRGAAEGRAASCAARKNPVGGGARAPATARRRRPLPDAPQRPTAQQRRLTSTT